MQRAMLRWMCTLALLGAACACMFNAPPATTPELDAGRDAGAAPTPPDPGEGSPLRHPV